MKSIAFLVKTFSPNYEIKSFEVLNIRAENIGIELYLSFERKDLKKKSKSKSKSAIRVAKA
jgi:hypothetical protein